MKIDKPLLKSLLVHIVCFMILGMSLRFSEVIHVPQASMPVMQAVMIDNTKAYEKAKIEKEQAKQRAEEQKAIEAQQKALKQKALKEQQLLQEQKNAQIAMQKAQKEAEAKKKAAEKQKKVPEPKKPVVEPKKKVPEESKKVAEKKTSKKITEQEKLARQKALQQEAEHALQEQLLSDQQHAQMLSEIEQYHQLIIARIQQHWRRDLDQTTGLSCLVRVRILATGEVIEATVIKSSGNLAFDRSATSAVMRATPLPLPEDERARNEFVRGFNFLFKPEDV